MSIKRSTDKLWDENTGHTVGEAFAWFGGLFHTWNTDDGCTGITFNRKSASNAIFGYSLLKESEERWQQKLAECETKKNAEANN